MPKGKNDSFENIFTTGTENNPSQEALRTQKYLKKKKKQESYFDIVIVSV